MLLYEDFFQHLFLRLASLLEIDVNKHTSFVSLKISYLIVCLSSTQAREFANELRASTKASRNPTVWLEGSTGSSQSVSNVDTSTVSEAYSKMLTIFIPLLVDEVMLLTVCFYLEI